jgi:hypothetical protein
MGGLCGGRIVRRLQRGEKFRDGDPVFRTGDAGQVRRRHQALREVTPYLRFRIGTKFYACQADLDFHGDFLGRAIGNSKTFLTESN